MSDRPNGRRARKRLLANAAGAAVLVCIWSALVAADWPTYLHDPARSGSTGDNILSTVNASQLVKLWSYKTGGPIAASAAIVGGIAYVGSWDGYEYALNATTGALQWKTFLGITVGGPGCNGPTGAGVSSGAAVANGVVYVGGGDSYWYALDATTGAVLWRVFTGDNSAVGGHYNWSSPLLYNGAAYVGVASLADCPLVQGQLLKVDLGTHQVVATYNTVASGQIGGGIWTSPALDATTNTVYVTTGTASFTGQPYAQSLLALDAGTLTLKSVWQLPPAQAVNDSDWGTTPIVFSDALGDQLVAAINKNGIAYAFNRANLTAGPVWQSQVAYGGQCPVCGDGSVSSSAFANGTLFLSGGNTTIGGRGALGAVRAVDPTTGSFRWEHSSPSPVIPALAYDNGLIIDGAGPYLEVLDAATGNRLYSFMAAGTFFGAPSVSNGRILIGSTDGNVYAFGLPATIGSVGGDSHCPAGWTCQDIGKPTPSGKESVSGSTWTVTVGGSGIGGTADHFRLISQNVSGDLAVTTLVTWQQPASTNSQAGLMVRQRNDPGAPYFAVLDTTGNGLRVAYRSTFGGPTTIASAPPSPTSPVYLEIQRRGDRFQAATSSDGLNYTLIAGANATVVMPGTVMAGTATSSTVVGTAATARYTGAAVGAPGSAPYPYPSQDPCFSGWNCADVGNPSIVGDQTANGATWSLVGAGADIANYADQFHYVWQVETGDATLSAHLTTQTNTNASAKAGLMLRQSSDPGSVYYATFVTPSAGIIVQYRALQGLRTVRSVSVAGAVPAYLQVTRSGSTFCTFSSTDGVTWTYLVGSCAPITMTAPIMAGLAITSQNIKTSGTVTADTISLVASAPAPPTVCPTGWACADIGNPSMTGSQSFANGQWDVLGTGEDVWSDADQFRFVWQTLVGDGSVSAQLISQTSTDPWAKAGVMLRQTADANAAYYAAYLTPANGIVVQYRVAVGAFASQAVQVAGVGPQFLLVSRSASTFATYVSSDGSTWTKLAGSTVTIPMAGSVLAGMAVTSHNAILASDGVFRSVQVSATNPSPPACPTAWSCGDIGAVSSAGDQFLNGGTWTIDGDGADIWGTADAFHYVWQTVTGDGTISAHLTAQTATDAWAKAGLMLRATTDPGSPYYALEMTPGNGLVVQYRATQSGSANQAATIAATVPAYLEIGRSGTTFVALTSPDGISWSEVSGSRMVINVTGPMLIGMAVTSHNTIVQSGATFDTVNVVASAPSAAACPSGWTCADIGSPTPAGSQSLVNGAWTVQGGGADIWGTSDQFHFVYATMAADGTMSGLVTSQTNTDLWAKAGIMLRESSDPSAAYYAVFVTPGNGVVVQYRSAAGVTTSIVASVALTTPVYLEVGRVGSTLTAYTSTDGVTWTAIPGSATNTGITGALLEGMAVTSHNSNTIGIAGFASVTPS